MERSVPVDVLVRDRRVDWILVNYALPFTHLVWIRSMDSYHGAHVTIILLHGVLQTGARAGDEAVGQPRSRPASETSTSISKKQLSKPRNRHREHSNTLTL